MDLRLSPVLLVLVLLLPIEIFNRARLEFAMKSYVAQQEPYLVKRLRQKQLEELLNYVPAPSLYHRMIEGSVPNY